MSYDDQNFRGMTRAALLIDDVGENGRQCGLDTAQLRSALELAINTSTRIRPTDNSAEGPVIVLETTVVKNADVCAINVRLSIQQIVSVKLIDALGERRHTVVLWVQNGLFLGGANANSGRYVTGKVADMGNLLASTWQRMNP